MLIPHSCARVLIQNASKQCQIGHRDLHCHILMLAPKTSDQIGHRPGMLKKKHCPSDQFTKVTSVSLSYFWYDFSSLPTDYLCNVVEALEISTSPSLRHIEKLLKIPLSEWVSLPVTWLPSLPPYPKSVGPCKYIKVDSKAYVSCLLSGTQSF